MILSMYHFQTSDTLKSEVGIKIKRKTILYKRNVSCNEKIENDNKTKKGIADVYVIAK